MKTKYLDEEIERLNLLARAMSLSDQGHSKLREFIAIKQKLERLHPCKYVKKQGESCTLNNNCKYPNCDDESTTDKDNIKKFVQCRCNTSIGECHGFGISGKVKCKKL